MVLKLLAILYFMARKITAEVRRAVSHLFSLCVPLRTLRLNSLFGCSMLRVLGSFCVVKSHDSGFGYLSSYGCVYPDRVGMNVVFGILRLGVIGWLRLFFGFPKLRCKYHTTTPRCTTILDEGILAARTPMQSPKSRTVS